MFSPTIDVAPTLSRPSTATAADHDPAVSPSRTSSPGSPKSLLDDWENWPENDPNFDPAFDSARPLREVFCECKRPVCAFCSETRQVFHVSEYASDGQCVMDRKVDTKELHDHLQELDRADKAPNRPSMRIFFVCGNYVKRGLSFAYMRHFLAYCRIPPHFSLRMNQDDCLPVFQAAYEPAGDDPSETQRGILHIYLQTFSYVMDSDILAKPEYYSEEFEPKVCEWVKGGIFSSLSPALYLRYDESSRECDVYVADSTMTFHSLRGIFSTGSPVANQDPFLIVALFLQHRVAELQKYVHSERDSMRAAISQARRLTSLDTDSTDLFNHFSFLAVGGPSNARMGREASSILRALEMIKSEHRLFLEREGDAAFKGQAARMIGRRFQRQHEHLLELESALSAIVTGIEIVKDLMAGRAQILNGIDMARMAKDSQKQAVATEAFAEDARNDSKIMKRDSATMKTITVVTLVYLPATFVSTLLSMGIFDFGVGTDGDGRLRVSRAGWVFLAIALPLTILTLGLAFLWKRAKELEWKIEEDAAAAKKQREDPGEADGEDALAEADGAGRLAEAGGEGAVAADLAAEHTVQPDNLSE